MSKMIFVNLPVSHLTAAVSFYQALGFVQNPQFSDDTAACMVWSDSIFVMLLTHAKWQTFTQRPVPANSSSEVMLALNCEDKAAVDHLCAAASSAGGTADVNPIQDLGFMYGRSVLDLDGHIWEFFWMDPAATQG
ncbi:VOC family protein [Rheinheimera sp.]|uniref:VOC family protein n=1 Tax=Rheinheimera sp. TaxID=1869214 RepID=UPI00307F2949